MNIDISPTDILEREADGRGRITLGSEYADRDLSIAILGDNNTQVVEYRQYHLDHQLTAFERQEHHREMHEVAPEHRGPPPGVSVEYLTGVREVSSISPTGRDEPGVRATVKCADGSSMELEHVDILSIEPERSTISQESDDEISLSDVEPKNPK
ncbi:hypothetical protein [Halocatena halophila]|uniref:hypothetical protein n=1 Tax=Halocatena halophila TaxID=2814576 RepID=UPI002ED00913